MVERRDTGSSFVTFIPIESCHNAEKLYTESSVSTVRSRRLVSDIDVYTQKFIVMLTVSPKFNAYRAHKDDVVC